MKINMSGSALDTAPMATFFADGVRSIAVHNNVVRVEFTRLDSKGLPHGEIELLIPENQVGSLIAGLTKMKP